MVLKKLNQARTYGGYKDLINKLTLDSLVRKDVRIKVEEICSDIWIALRREVDLNLSGVLYENALYKNKN